MLLLTKSHLNDITKMVQKSSGTTILYEIQAVINDKKDPAVTESQVDYYSNDTPWSNGGAWFKTLRVHVFEQVLLEVHSVIHVPGKMQH